MVVSDVDAGERQLVALGAAAAESPGLAGGRIGVGDGDRVECGLRRLDADEGVGHDRTGVDGAQGGGHGGSISAISVVGDIGFIGADQGAACGHSERRAGHGGVEAVAQLVGHAAQVERCIRVRVGDGDVAKDAEVLVDGVRFSERDGVGGGGALPIEEVDLAWRHGLDDLPGEASREVGIDGLADRWAVAIHRHGGVGALVRLDDGGGVQAVVGRHAVDVVQVAAADDGARVRDRGVASDVGCERLGRAAVVDILHGDCVAYDGGWGAKGDCRRARCRRVRVVGRRCRVGAVDAVGQRRRVGADQRCAGVQSRRQRRRAVHTHGAHPADGICHTVERDGDGAVVCNRDDAAHLPATIHKAGARHLHSVADVGVLPLEQVYHRRRDALGNLPCVGACVCCYRCLCNSHRADRVAVTRRIACRGIWDHDGADVGVGCTSRFIRIPLLTGIRV